MQAGWVLLYFMLGCAVLAMLAFPRSFGAITRRWRRLWRISLPEPSLWGWYLRRRWNAWLRGESRLDGPDAPVWSARRLALWAVALLALPVGLTVAWAHWSSRTLDGFDDRVAVADGQVSSLLAGEHLSPPAPLPPEVFTTAEVEIERPMTASADRQWDRLQPEFVQRLLRIIQAMRDTHGYEVVLLEGYRSPERQAALATKGQHVTMVGAWQSYHQYGMAADVAFWREGRLVISERDPWAQRGYELLGQVAESHGMTWGGRWKMRDLGHVEWRTAAVRQAMRAARSADTSSNTNTP